MCQALYSTFTFKKTSIISTKNKKLVDQIYDDCCFLYKNQKINNKNIKDKKILILKHTKEDHLSKELLLDLFIKGEGVIITVHNYLYAFDDFYNVSFLNALTYVFPSLVNIFYDEANFYIENNYFETNLVQTLVKHNDTLMPGSVFYVNEDWLDVDCIDHAIKVINTCHYKNTGNDNISVIKEGINNYNKNLKVIDINGFFENDEPSIKLKNAFKNENFDEIKLLDNNIKIQTLTSKKYDINLNSELKEQYKREKYQLLAYNYLSTILKTIISVENPRKLEDFNSKFKKIIESDLGNKEVELSSFFIQLNAFVKMNYFENNLLLNDEEKIDFLNDFDILFEKYQKEAIYRGRLFNIVSIDNGKECLLRLIYTSSDVYVTIYYSYGLICQLIFNNNSSKNKDYSFKIINVKEKIINNKFDLYELKSNSDKVKNLVKIIKAKCLTNKKNNKLKENEDFEDSNEKGENEYPNFKTGNFNKILNLNLNSLKDEERKKVFFELKEMFENDLTDLAEEKKQINLNILLKIKHPNELTPFGIKIEMHRDLDISRRLLGDRRIFTSAGYSVNSLNVFSNINKSYSEEHNIYIKEHHIEKFESSRKIDNLFILPYEFNCTTNFSNKDFIKNYWNSFAENFYNYFTKNKSIKEKQFGMIGLPSNSKVISFYEFINFKNFASYISVNDQKTNPNLESVEDYNYTKNFNPTQKLIQSESLVITSVFSTASIGLNMPHLFYLNVSLNNFKPKHTHERLSIKINNKITSPKFDIIQDSVTQILGRLTRMNKYDIKQNKILEISKKLPYDDMLFFHIFYPRSLKLFENVYVVDIIEYESFSISLIRSKKAKLFFTLYQQHILKNYVEPLSLNIAGEYFAEFKVETINLLKNYNEKGDYNFLFKQIVKKYYKNILNLLFMIIIGQIYDHICNTTTKVKTKFSYSKLKNQLALSKITLYNNFYLILESFYNEFKERDISSNEFIKIYNSYENNSLFSIESFIDLEIDQVKLNITDIKNN